MKLKNKYIIRSVADKAVAIAIENADEKTDGVITLNPSGAFIFGLINQGATEEEIVAKFFEEYEVKKDEAAASVAKFIEKLKEKGLLED